MEFCIFVNVNNNGEFNHPKMMGKDEYNLHQGILPTRGQATQIYYMKNFFNYLDEEKRPK